ncbi:MAG: hypothetical protein AABZ13_10650, partial [Planctomycetota bacterium]
YSNFEFGCGQRPRQVYLLLDLTCMPVSPPLRSGKRKGFFGYSYAAPGISNGIYRRVLGNSYVEPNLIDLQYDMLL